MVKSVPAATLFTLFIHYTIISSGFDIHINGSVKQRTLVMQYSTLQPSHCGEQVTSRSNIQHVFKHAKSSYGTLNFCFETQMLSTCIKTSKSFAKQASLAVFLHRSQRERIGGVCVRHNRCSVKASRLGALEGWTTAKALENSDHIFSETHSNEGVKERV